MAATIYALCALTALICAFLLLQSYRRNRYRLLFWSGLCFVGLTMNNILLVLDKVVFPDVDLFLLRSIVGLMAVSVLLFGLIWTAD